MIFRFYLRVIPVPTFDLLFKGFSSKFVIFKKGQRKYSHKKVWLANKKPFGLKVHCSELFWKSRKIFTKAGAIFARLSKSSQSFLGLPLRENFAISVNWLIEIITWLKSVKFLVLIRELTFEKSNKNCDRTHFLRMG